MKKIYTLLAFIFAGLAVANAQRNVDWSVDQILEPSELNSNTSQGTAVDFTLVLKNLGPDSCIVGDTILVQLAVRNAQGQNIFIAPSNNSFYLDVNDKILRTGDTVHFRRAFVFPYYYPNSINVKMVAASSILNRTNAIAAEVAPGNANNLKEKDMVWYNPQGWGVSVGEVTLSEIFTVYPNPAADVINLEWQLTAAGNVATTVNIYSIEGRLVKTEILDGFGHGQVSVEDLENGMYLVEFESGAIKSTQKVQISK